MSNAAKLNPIVDIVIGDKTIPVKFGIRAFRRLEEKTGKSLFSGEMFEEIGINDVVLLLWAGMLHQNKDLEIEDVEDMFELQDLTAVSAKVIEALNVAFKLASPDSKKNEEVKEDKPAELPAVEARETKAA